MSLYGIPMIKEAMGKIKKTPDVKKWNEAVIEANKSNPPDKQVPLSVVPPPAGKTPDKPTVIADPNLGNKLDKKASGAASDSLWDKLMSIRVGGTEDEVSAYNPSKDINEIKRITSGDFPLVPYAAAMSIPGILGNSRASNVSGTSSLAKSLLAILAGSGAGVGAMAYTLPSALSFGLPGLAGGLGGAALASGVGSYTTRRLLDILSKKEVPEVDR